MGPSLENLEVLLSLLDKLDDSGFRIMKGEILRQLDRFDETREALLAVTEPEWSDVVHFLVALCERRDHRVREFCPGDQSGGDGDDDLF